MSSADKAQANIDQAKANAEKQINEVKHVADRNLNKAKDNASQAKKTFLQKLEDDGV
jgi:vacuolar-type H+-ATPase subunit H